MSVRVEGSKIPINPQSGILKGTQQGEQNSHGKDFGYFDFDYFPHI